MSETKTARCIHCKRPFPVTSYNDGLVNCPSCGMKTTKMSPSEWQKFEQEQKKTQKQMKVAGAILLVVLALVVWGVSSCVGKYRANRKAELEYAKEHGTIGMAKSICKEHLLKGIISPASAKITFEREEERGDNLYAFAGYIDAQNSFGAMIRNKFVVVVSYNPDKGYRVEASDISP